MAHLQRFKDVPNLSCFRESPRPCLNQDIIDELALLRKARFIEFGTQTPESISYATASSIIIGCPHRITTQEEAEALNKVGGKIGQLIGEFLRTGKIALAREKREDPRLKARAELMKVHGVGYTAANRLYNEGIRTLDDLRSTGKYEQAFKYHDDINLPMTPEEVESVADFIRLQLDRVEEGAHTVLCGGYRRGKKDSNDVDLLITYPHEDGKERFVLDRLVKRLQAKGLIPPGGVLSQTNCASLRTTDDNRPASLLDALDKALVIFKHPANSTTRPRDIYRRVDLIVTCWSSYGAAVVGWTGSTQFERDLRTHAKTLGYKFDSGGLRTADTNDAVPTMMEEDVFRVLKLPWIPPELRNADP